MFEEKKGLLLGLTAAVCTLGILTSSMVVTYGWVKTKYQPNTIVVTGSAKKQIKSDYVTWKGTFSRQNADLAAAYKDLQGDLVKVKKYLADNGLAEKDYTISSVNTVTNYVPSNNGYSLTSKVESYRLTQDVDIRSNDVDKITSISRDSTRLIQDGVQFQSAPPMYFYTKIADLKVDMLALATSDAKNRADKIAQNAGSKLSNLKTAKMGVFQITPVNSNEVTDYGINDTSSIEKEIMSVVNCTFESK